MTASTPNLSGPNFNLEGKTALITGAGRGIGLAVSQAWAAAGARVILVARTADEVRDAALYLNTQGAQAEWAALDAQDKPAMEALLREKGPVHVLFNNAGTNRPADFLEVKEEEFDVVFNLNVRAAFFVAQAVARAMVASKIKGSIINVSSQMGLVGGKRRSVYCASKHAMEGMTKAMALDLAPHGIRVNTICPTFIETPLTRPYLQDKQFMADVLGSIPLGRLGQVEDLTGAAVFLASDASALMTGSALVVDGGWTAR